jgi:hypothetical protein
MTSNRPESDIDLFCDDTLCDPYPAYREMRAILESLAKRVSRFDILEMERGLNNTLRGIKHLEVAAHRT